MPSGRPRVLLIHGSATDRTSWAVQLASPLRDRFELIAYDRGTVATSVEAQAAEAEGILGGQPALIVGSSFGAVVGLELVRTRPQLCVGAVLIEPPMSADDERPAAPAEFMREFDQIAAERGGPAAGEFFLREVLGEEAYAKIPLAFRERSANKWEAIRADSQALIAYRPRYAELAAIQTPMLLVGGDRSARYFRDTLDALARALPRARLEVITGAGHMLQVEAPKRFAQLLIGFAEEIGIG